MNDTMPDQTKLDFSIVSPKLTIEAMRDSGYKSTDHALAELIDNSVEAAADLIEVIAVEQPRDPQQPYSRARLLKMAVVDNGEGMDFVTLRRALRFGDGTRLDRAARGIGRFGVGLPQSSVSQCRRVDIWTWQNGAANALHCYLDLDEIRAGDVRDVPAPTAQPVPEEWIEVAENASEATGTLVVWSRLDRVRWSGGWKTLARTGDLCGRVYRKFLSDEDWPVVIRLRLASLDDEMLNVEREEDCFPNDPLYLMAPSATPKPFDDKPMYELFNERTWALPVEDEDGEVETGEVKVKCTLARRDAINEGEAEVEWPKSYANPGSAPWGKHANRNKGVSIVRADRELELSLAWVNNHEPEERWWSVEVDFDPLLDEIFGVVNNKQHAHAFVAGAGFDWKDSAEEGETFGAFKERLEETGDDRAYLVEIWDWIEKQIREMRKERKKIRKGARGSRHPQTGTEIEDVATTVINADPKEGDSDRAPKATDEEKIQQIVDHRPNRVDASTAREWAEETVGNHRRVLTKSVSLGHGNPAFFEVESVADVIEIWLNDRHPVHERLIEVVDASSEDQTAEQLGRRLQEAAFTLRMLLIAWARLEDKTPSGQWKESVRDVRADWGRETRKFLSVIES